MRVLIDTHCWLWLNIRPQRLSEESLNLLKSPSTDRLLSVASIWEIAIKHQLGKLPLPVAPKDYLPRRLETTRTRTLPISDAHALRVSDLEPHHRDPFDRMIIAQSLVEGIPVLTADPGFTAYGVELIDT